jgi:hypothetical protein
MTPEELNLRLIQLLSENRRLQRHINVQMMTILAGLIKRLKNNEIEEAVQVVMDVHELYKRRVTDD